MSGAEFYFALSRGDPAGADVPGTAGATEVPRSPRRKPPSHRRHHVGHPPAELGAHNSLFIGATAERGQGLQSLFKAGPGTETTQMLTHFPFLREPTASVETLQHLLKRRRTPGKRAEVPGNVEVRAQHRAGPCGTRGNQGHADCHAGVPLT